MSAEPLELDAAPARERQGWCAAEPFTAAYPVGRGLLRGAPTVHPIGRLTERAAGRRSSRANATGVSSRGGLRSSTMIVSLRYFATATMVTA